MVGQVCGLIVALTGLAAATYMAVNGAPTAGAVVGGVTLVGMVTAFIAGRSNPQPKEAPTSREGKQKAKR